tara:strand:+ start:1611 stop:1826 length:216 start_codon:yes stop_codon:yes gene_type:complete
MDETTQNDIINVLRKANRFDLIAIMLTVFEGMDSDFEYDSPDEPHEEFMEGGAVEEDNDFSVTEEGFHYLT